MGGKGGKSVTVGYRYYWDIQSGIGRGPIDELVELRVDDKTAYATEAGEITQSRAIYIDKPDLFGGDDTGGEGGIKGRMEISFGYPDQQTPAMFKELINNVRAEQAQSKQGKGATFPDSYGNSSPTIQNAHIDSNELMPAFRGIVTTLFSGLISCYSAYPKKHSYRVRRALKGWSYDNPWYPQKCKIILRNDHAKLPGLTEAQAENIRTIHAMNPAHILVECATNQSWGGKKSLDDLDLESYRKAANTLFDEGFGLCLRYNRQNSIASFIQQVLDHIGAVQYDNIQTGKQAIRLLRQDYDPTTLTTYGYDNGILRVQDDNTPATDTAANQIIIKYKDPVLNKEEQAIANNIAMVRRHGAIAKVQEYFGIPTFDLAARVAQRDLEMTASGLIRLKIAFNALANTFKPGDVFKVHLPERGLEQVIFRISRIENGNEGEIIVTCMEDVFGLPSNNYSSQQGGLYDPPDYTALPLTNIKLVDLPYHMLPVYLPPEEIAKIKPSQTLALPLATPPNHHQQSYNVHLKQGDNYINLGRSGFVYQFELAEDLTTHSPTLTLANTDGIANSDTLKAMNALMINDEIVRIDDVDLEQKNLTVGRGCADTVPQHHKKGSICTAYLFATPLSVPLTITCVRKSLFYKGF